MGDDDIVIVPYFQLASLIWLMRKIHILVRKDHFTSSFAFPTIDIFPGYFISEAVKRDCFSASWEMGNDEIMLTMSLSITIKFRALGSQ